MFNRLKQSTTGNIKIGPFLDKTNGVDFEVGLAGAMVVYLSKNEGNFGARNSATAIAYDSHGFYTVELDATDKSTIGKLVVMVDDAATHLPVWHEYEVAVNLTTLEVKGRIGYSAAGVLTALVRLEEEAQTVDCTACTINIYDYDGTLVLANAGWDTAPTENVGQYTWYARETSIALVAGEPYYALVSLTYGGVAHSRLLDLEIAALTIPAITDAIWDEARAGHVIAGSYGETSSTVISVTAQAGCNLTTITTNLTETTDDHYIGRIVIFVTGNLYNQATDITDYDGVTKNLTVTAMTEAPALNDRFVIV
jgi:hypothetical protein